jgi:hypothetical protein
MNQRRTLNTWKEIAVYLSRGVRTVQRWELLHGMPVRRVSEESSVYAFADEIDEWLRRMKPAAVPYVRPTLVIAEAASPEALSNLKLAIEGAKFNVLTAFTSAEVLATAAKFDVDGFILDSILLDNPEELSRQLRQRYPAKCLVLVGESSEHFDLAVPQNDPAVVVEWLIGRFGRPHLG